MTYVSNPPKCPHCGFTVFTNRYPKCEKCGVQLPADMVLSKEELDAVLTRETAEADATSLAKQNTGTRTTADFNVPLLGVLPFL
jgi:tRNA(Ile2) C34 agmatinyltransferase TiaS